MDKNKLKLCTKKDLQRKAITIKSFDGSLWANLGNGQFINRETKKILSVNQLYRQIRTVVFSGGIVSAKRKNRTDTLRYLEKPIKIKSW
ncbi:hypothetical protein [Enterococcus faecium]|uniref:hypothetical protein n=1 Tax=Enterococcus faecium TaxID=1352 RepID=UPI0023B3101C|nr:hypothetical protein [Enterococcus faecium]